MTHTQRNQKLQALLEEQLTPFVQEVVHSFDLAGLAIGVVASGELVYARGFGVRNRATGDPVTPQSLFHLASVSKSFVATAIMQLVEQGRIDLDAPVAAYLPYFSLNDPRAGAITVQQMLSHTSGMPDEVDFRWYAPEDDEQALERYVRSLASRTLVAAPGERYAYSNCAFEVLGDVIAKVSGQSFEAYVKTHILDPAGMHASTFIRREVAPDHAVAPHFGAPLRTLPDAYPYHRAHAPSSSLHSSIAELSRWVIVSRQRGQIEQTRILADASYDLLWRQHVQTGEQGWDEAVGLGWFFGTYRGHQMIYHNGSDPGFASEVVLLPSADAAVITLVNANTTAIGFVSDAALGLLLGETPQLPQPPISLPVGVTLAAYGPVAAIKRYHQIMHTEQERYDRRPVGLLDTVWGALEMHRVEEVLPLIHVWITLQPDASEAHEALGWAQLILGDRDAAERHLRQAVTLDADNIHAAALLQSSDFRLDGPG